MANSYDEVSAWEAPEFKARVAELINEGKSEDAAWAIAADELYPVIWVPPTLTRH